MTSAYPIPTDVLTDKVRALALELGAWPSQRRVMRTCRVGAPRADAALETLRTAGFDPTAPPASGPHPALTIVPNVDSNALDSTSRATGPAVVDAEHRTNQDTPVVPDTIVASDAAAGPDAGPTVTQVTDAAETPTETSAEAPAEAAVEERSAVGGVRVRARVARWPLLPIALGAFVAIWGGWVGLGQMAGFGPINLLPGIGSGFVINSAITLPLGVEAYAAYALRVWLSPASRSVRARAFARWSATGSLVLGALGQVAYHVLTAADVTHAPWWITTFVSVLPVVVLGCGAALTHLLHDPDTDSEHEEATR